MSSRALIPAMMLAGMSQFINVNAFAVDNPVIVWNANAGVAATKACISPTDDPFHESYAYATMHIAIHDALNAIDRKFQPHTFDIKAEPGTSPDAAVAAAAHDALVSVIKRLPDMFTKACIDGGVASVDAAYTAILAKIPDGPAKTKGITLGQASASAILAKRANDHADGGPFINKNCPPAGAPGAYQCTPGFPVQFVAFEKWADVTPWVLHNNAQFRPGPPYALTDPKYKADFDEVKSLGGDGKTTPTARTEDQSQIALFWLESSPLKWSRIARTVATDKSQNMWESARLFAILNMALSDGYVAMSASKNLYQFWRPVTAIRRDGDPSWTPFQVTPPNQDYPSGHAIEGGAGAEVLKQLFATDQVNFRDCSTTLPAGTTCYDPNPVHRSYTSFSQAADENALSRILVGFHFRDATTEGIAYGRKIGEQAATLLPPAK